SIPEIQQWIREKARNVPANQWIEVPRNEITRLKEHRFPTPVELDAGDNEHPVVYTSVTKHVFNTSGFRALGIIDSTSKLPDGEMVRDDAGQPVLVRGGNISLSKLMPAPTETREETLEALKRVHHRYNEVGITTIFERATDRFGFAMFR